MCRRINWTQNKMLLFPAYPSVKLLGASASSRKGRDVIPCCQSPASESTADSLMRPSKRHSRCPPPLSTTTNQPCMLLSFPTPTLPPLPLLAEKCAAVTVSLYAVMGPEIAPFSLGRDKATTSISSNVRRLNHPELEGLNLNLRWLRAGIIFLSHYHSLLRLSFSLSDVRRALALCSVCVGAEDSGGL